MNKIVCAVATVACATLSFAAPFDDEGGLLVKKGSYLGKIAFVDTQTKVPFDCAKNAAETLAKETKMNIFAVQHSPAKAADLKKELGVQVVVVLTDDPNAPLTLLAPDEHWAVVNAAKLVDDLPGASAKKRFIVGRAQKKLVCAFSLICGGGSSQFPGNIMNAPTLKELDLIETSIPVDMINHYNQHLKHWGVTPKSMVSYEQSCREGWAPKPTNDVQKAIWDIYHTLPDKPIKIEFDPKRDAKK